MSTTPSLDPLDERLAAIEARLERLTRTLDTILPNLAMAADAFDAFAAEQQRRGVDLDGHVQHAMVLLERLTDPDVAGRLERLVELLPRLVPVAELAATFEPTTAMVADMVDEQVRRLEARGIDAEARCIQVLQLVERLTDPAFHSHLNALLDAAPGLMAATRTGEVFGRAVDSVVAHGAEPVGLFGLLRALSKPDVQRALGLSIAVAERVGQELPTTHLQRK